MQVLTRTDAKLPDGFGPQSRMWSAKNFNRMLDVIKRAEQDIPAKYWIDVPAENLPQYEELFRQMRIKLKGTGEYDATMLALLRRVRCKDDPTRAECAEKKE